MVASIPITIQKRADPAAAAYFSRLPKQNEPQDATPLRRAIRTALHGTDQHPLDIENTQDFLYDFDVCGDEEISWNEHTVVLSSRGIIRKQWSFKHEGQRIHWACLGLLEQYAEGEYPTASSSQSKNLGGESDVLDDSDKKPRATFGPFAKLYRERSQTEEKSVIIPAVFIFLRSMGMIYLRNGVSYTFQVPFIVRQAWPISPHGVLIQRGLEPGEMEEAEVSGEPLLPTIFSLTTPFAEAGAIGLTTGIIGGYNSTPISLKDDAANKPLKSVEPTELVVWVSRKCSASQDEVLVTVDIQKGKLSVWRYAHLPSKDIPEPLQKRTRSSSHKRQSVSTKDRRRSGGLNVSLANLEDEFANFPPNAADAPPLSALPKMPPTLSTTTTMASLIPSSQGSQWSGSLPLPSQKRRNSLSRNELSLTMDRMVLGGRIGETDPSLSSIEYSRLMKPVYWMEKIYTQDISVSDAQAWHSIQVALFDSRWDGKLDRTLMAICFPNTRLMNIFTLTHKDGKLEMSKTNAIPAISAAPVRSTRPNVWDLVLVKPDHSVYLLTSGLKEIPLALWAPDERPLHMMDIDSAANQLVGRVQPDRDSILRVEYTNGQTAKAHLNLIPQDSLTLQSLQILALALPPDLMFDIQCRFLQIWASRGLSHHADVEFSSFSDALYACLDLQVPSPSYHLNSLWDQMASTRSHRRFKEDPILKHLRPPQHTSPVSLLAPASQKRSGFLGAVLYALHTLGEDLRISTHRYKDLPRLVRVICRIAILIRPEWSDYWRRLSPESCPVWPSAQSTAPETLDIPVWPPDLTAILYGRIANAEWKVSFHDPLQVSMRFTVPISFAYGRFDPLQSLARLTSIYRCLADNNVPLTHKRAENAIYHMVTSGIGADFINRLPLGLASPVREAARTCQLAPPANWPLEAYRAIGREDVAASANLKQEIMFKDGYRPAREHLNPPRSRPSMEGIVKQTKFKASGNPDTVTGVEFDPDDFTNIRFGQDRRLEEVARMLCSSTVASLKVPDRPELSEHDQQKEQQHQALRIAERTLSLPYGRAMFTYGSIPKVTKESYAVPKIELTVRLHPANVTVSLEPGKILPESLAWGEFHNGVAAALRISPFSDSIESSWIAFNKPAELTPEHAGILFGFGLTGHLRHMVTWNTFTYLTPKHDPTSVGVLLGLSAANIGNKNEHITKLLAVHTPALLPTPNVDLNVSLMTQAAGLSGMGLLYLGTKDRRMAEVCLHQISRRDLVQPDLSNEYREAYTYSAALAFGMIMLGKGTTIPADVTFLNRLTVLIHGEPHLGPARPSFDINLTSPAATVALGLMYLRTERKDIADILVIPDTVLALNRIQPSFLLMRTFARALILWDTVQPTPEWLSSQIPSTIKAAIESRFKTGQHVDDALELAYYNIIAGSCFAIGLKYAGTARQEAYKMIIRYLDLYTRLIYTNGATFDHRIKRSAVRDGLNLIAISLSMVMAGTGEITCFRRLRYAFGMYAQTMYHPAFKYGIHVSTHMALGLLFIGGGRFTLGTSDAAIACMVAAFFPRFNTLSSDNKSYLQALRHLWVLAVEPRCLVARDVENEEVVYLPLKLSLKDDGATQLVSPTLIPDIDRILAIRVDTPRYWPFHLDLQNTPHHRETLLRRQTLYVKRRTAFLSYTEDPRGSKSLFVRSRSSVGEAATLDFPQVTDVKIHPAGDLAEFIGSLSNDALFLAFADHFTREDGETQEERVFQTYCHAALFDAILQGKPHSLQAHLTLLRYRNMLPTSQYFQVQLQDLRSVVDFYTKVYDRRFSGRTESNYRAPLLRDTTVMGALHALDERLETLSSSPTFSAAFAQYVKGEAVVLSSQNAVGVSQNLAWYLLRHSVPVSTLLVLLREFGTDAHQQCLAKATPDQNDAQALSDAVKLVVHATGLKMVTVLGSGWTMKSLDEIVNAWTS